MSIIIPGKVLQSKFLVFISFKNWIKQVSQDFYYANELPTRGSFGMQGIPDLLDQGYFQ